ncbi:transcriptional regulator [Chitinophaga skermanii]|uniref:Transcriptional regulator n=1 Tax=Chitinophaga skermanii TaxID=331697 RepID=A0A327QFL5_9BACT|nr:metalloregulator ArsR/SmtB family transcription factor [Chitinophaga skermanii]RAJ02412.1 transcriptional regulator [Chitinophaga skermanii]
MINNLPDHERALWILKTKGDLPLTALADILQVTVEGARFQLLKLAGEGLVKANTIAKGRGRPQQVYSLTPLGQARFPDTHADLTVRLINTMRSTLGDDALDAVIKAQQKQATERYTAELKPMQDLSQKVSALANIRNAEGYMAEMEKDGDGYLLIENHCPICAAATACQGFCKAELDTFKSVLGKQVKVERVDHIILGARRCAYKIEEK